MKGRYVDNYSRNNLARRDCKIPPPDEGRIKQLLWKKRKKDSFLGKVQTDQELNEKRQRIFWVQNPLPKIRRIGLIASSKPIDPSKVVVDIGKL
jgi:hypothetical protein